MLQSHRLQLLQQLNGGRGNGICAEDRRRLLRRIGQDGRGHAGGCLAQRYVDVAGQVPEIGLNLLNLLLLLLFLRIGELDDQRRCAALHDLVLA